MTTWRNKQILSWALYDWANSAFATSVAAGFFPIFFKQYCQSGVDAELSTLRLGVTNSTASLIVALLAPLCGALADTRSHKKRYLTVMMVLGAAATAALALVPAGAWPAAAVVYGLAILGFSGSNVFYDSLLPDVAAGDNPERVSSLGFALGYLGGGILFALNLLLLARPQLLGLADKTAATKASFISVGVWWLLFSVPLLLFVREKQSASSTSFVSDLRHALSRVLSTLRRVRALKHVAFFLVAYWLYIDGVYTVWKMAVDFGASIGLDAKDLVGALLLTQCVAFPSTLLWGHLAARADTKRLITGGLMIYAAVAVWAAFLSTAWEFYLLAVCIGVAQGGVQALSRAYYSRLIPPDQAAEFFGFYNLVGRAAAILGPVAMGAATYWSGSHQIGVLSLLVFFVGGGALLLLAPAPPAADPAKV